MRWDQINQSASAATSGYKVFNWASVDWSQVSPETLTVLNWSRINLKKAVTPKDFSVNLVDWSEVNSSMAATSAYKTFSWATIDPTSLTTTTLENVSWEKINWKKLPKTSTLAETVEESLGRDVNGDKRIGTDPAPTNTPQGNQTNTASPGDYYIATSGKDDITGLFLMSGCGQIFSDKFYDESTDVVMRSGDSELQGAEWELSKKSDDSYSKMVK